VFDERRFGDAAGRISLERCLKGEELSVFAVCDGESFQILNTAQDHKRAFDGDKGPNTGGMGAYSPTPLSTPNLIDRVSSNIIQPTLNAMIKRGNPYTGFLYVGLMIVDGDPYVIEFNVRMGDPETQVVLPLLKSSLFELLWNATDGKLKQTKVVISSQTSVTVVMAANGYPGKYKKGMRIKGLDTVKDRLVFHAGTRRQDHDIVTSGGRVLNAVGFGKDLSSAIDDVYDIVNAIDYRGKFYRKDIGLRGMQILTKG
jgi:phosphoribosylamine--glycine ligase